MSIANRPLCIVDAEQRLAGEVECGRCGYILKGLDPQGNCPECGWPIRATVADKSGHTSAASHWWNQSQLAMRMLLILAIVMTVVTGYLLTDLYFLSRDGQLLKILINGAALVMIFAGMSFVTLTMKPPNLDLPPSTQRRRRRARLTGLVCVVLLISAAGTVSYFRFAGPILSGAAAAVGEITYLFCLAAVLEYWCLLVSDAKDSDRGTAGRVYKSGSRVRTAAIAAVMADALALGLIVYAASTRSAMTQGYFNLIGVLVAIGVLARIRVLQLLVELRPRMLSIMDALRPEGVARAPSTGIHFSLRGSGRPPRRQS